MKRGALWPIGVAGVLALTVGANIALYLVARGDPSFAIEPDYYAKAVAWDSTVTQARRSAALGWRVTPSLASFAPRTGARLSVTITDSLGRQISDAVVRVSAVYNARAATVLASTLTLDERGYSAVLPVAYSGQWELRFDVTRGADHFTTTSRVDAVRTPGT